MKVAYTADYAKHYWPLMSKQEGSIYVDIMEIDLREALLRIVSVLACR